MAEDADSPSSTDRIESLIRQYYHLSQSEVLRVALPSLQLEVSESACRHAVHCLLCKAKVEKIRHLAQAGAKVRTLTEDLPGA